jgi:hypothetical protein
MPSPSWSTRPGGNWDSRGRGEPPGEGPHPQGGDRRQGESPPAAEATCGRVTAPVPRRRGEPPGEGIAAARKRGPVLCQASDRGSDRRGCYPPGVGTPCCLRPLPPPFPFPSPGSRPGEGTQGLQFPVLTQPRARGTRSLALAATGARGRECPRVQPPPSAQPGEGWGGGRDSELTARRPKTARMHPSQFTRSDSDAAG